MSRLLVASILCLAVAIAGCPMDSPQNPHSLKIHIANQSTEEGFEMNASVELEGNPPDDVVYEGVRVTLVDDSTDVATHELGNITTSRYSVNFKVSLSSRPQKILLQYNRVHGASQPGKVSGYRWDDGREVYEIYSNYSARY